MKIFLKSRVLGSEQEKFEYFFFFSISEENFIHEESDIEVRGFPGQVQMSYVCYHARTRKYGKEGEEDVYVHVFKEIEKLQFIYKFGLTKVVQSIKIFFNNRVLGSEQEKFEYLFFFSISEENFLHEESDIEVRGFPGQTQMSYVCYHVRTRKYGKEEEEDVYVHVFKEIEKKINDTHFIIKYTHQTSGGQSGGPVILHTDNDVQLIGIHVSGDQVSEINFI